MAEKKFNIKAYSIFAVVVVAVILAVLTVYTFTSRYTAFDPEKMAVSYVDTIIQTGDGYDAYKDTLLSKDMKFGDFIRQNYLYPVIYEGYTAGDSTKDLKGLNDESLMSDSSKNDDGSLEGKVIDNMYLYFVALVNKYNGFDNYDEFFTEYINELQIIRKEIYGDDYFDDDIFFDAFESNLAEYGETLTGTEDEFDSNTGVQTKEASVGAYQTKYGKDYKLQAVSQGRVGDSGDENTEVVAVDVLANGEKVASINVTLNKIGHSWYVDNTACDTTVLYTFYK